MNVAVVQRPRIAVSPYAKRLAHERAVPLERVTGSGPAGRIVAADVLAFVPQPAARAPAPSRDAAVAATLSLAKVRTLLGEFARDQIAVDLDDVLLRATGCALVDVEGASRLEGAPVALETRSGERPAQPAFSNVALISLGSLRQRRLAAADSDMDEADTPAVLSLCIVRSDGIRPMTMPLLPGRVMRLVAFVGEESLECLLSFDAGAIDVDTAAAVLDRLRAYLETPLLMLA